MTAKSGRRATAEEIYYISIKLIRIENYMAVPAAHPQPFLITYPSFPPSPPSLPAASYPLSRLFYKFSLMEAM